MIMTDSDSACWPPTDVSCRGITVSASPLCQKGDWIPAGQNEPVPESNLSNSDLSEVVRQLRSLVGQVEPGKLTAPSDLIVRLEGSILALEQFIQCRSL